MSVFQLSWKGVGAGGDIDPHSINLDNIKQGVISLTPSPLYPREVTNLPHWRTELCLLPLKVFDFFICCNIIILTRHSRNPITNEINRFYSLNLYFLRSVSASKNKTISTNFSFDRAQFQSLTSSNMHYNQMQLNVPQNIYTYLTFWHRSFTFKF